MRYAFHVPNFGDCGDPRMLADLAGEAEESGWDGFFVWDHLQWPGMEPAADPWVALAAAATATESIRLGPLVTPLPRRHPVKLAREAASLDRLSEGRAILGVGNGAPELPEFTAFGDEGDLRRRAAMLEEGLEVIERLWSGEPVSHRGEHYRVECEAFAPPTQSPRMPIWVAGSWPVRRPFRRAARWDGVVPIANDVMEGGRITPDDLRQLLAYVAEHREGDRPFDVAHFGQTRASGDTAQVAAYADAGATWWIEFAPLWEVGLEGIRRRLQDGPPRI